MTSNIDLQAIDRGLGALAGLVQNAEQNADVRAIVAVFRADFEAASQQINVLGDYKELHDLLHEVQFKCYNYIASQTTRFPEDELVVDTLIDHGLTFKGLVAKLHDVAARATVSGELTWIAELVGAESVLEQALETNDPAMLKRHCRLVRRVLDRYPSLVNTRLNSAARALRMDAIERAMTTILDMLRSRVGESAEVTSFAAGTASLANLGRHLTCLVRDHDRWQDVDVELRRVEATLSSDPEELQISWPDIKARTASLLCGQDESQPEALRQESVQLEEAFQANDPVNVRRHFMRFRRQAAEHFYRVDAELNTLCGQLRTIGAPLAAVAALVAALPPQHAQPAEIGFINRATPIRREHLKLMLEELTHKYDTLTERIAALDRDIDHTLDSEQSFVLKLRRNERTAERDELVAIRSQIEDQLENERAGCGSLDKLRCDVAVPDTVFVKLAFDLAVAIRQPTSPKLDEADLSRVQTGDLQIEWPQEQRGVRLHIQIEAPACEIAGAPSRKFQLFRGEDSPVFCWHLIPQRLGDVSIIVNVYQVDGWLGSARVHTTAVQQFAGEVRVTVHAVDLPSEKRASLERQLAEYRENLRIIEEQKSLFVEASSIPLQIIKEEQVVRRRIAELESQLGPQP